MRKWKLHGYYSHPTKFDREGFRCIDQGILLRLTNDPNVEPKDFTPYIVPKEEENEWILFAYKTDIL